MLPYYLVCAIVFVLASIFLCFWIFIRCYIGGTNLRRLSKIVGRLRKRNLGCTIDILGENVNSAEKVQKCFESYVGLILWMGLSEDKNQDNYKHTSIKRSVSLKPTNFGLRFDYELCLRYLKHLIALAHKNNVFVWIDAEHRDMLNPTLKLAHDLQYCTSVNLYGAFGLAVQVRHSASKNSIIKCVHMNVPVRLCKGAYPDGDITDENEIREKYFDYALYLLQKGVFVAIATADSAIIKRLTANIENSLDGSNLGNNSSPAFHNFVFQGLLGVRVSYQEELASEYPFEVYIPFGKVKNCIKYLIRRALEGFRNFSLLWLFIRNVWEGFLFSFKKY